MLKVAFVCRHPSKALVQLAQALPNTEVTLITSRFSTTETVRGKAADSHSVESISDHWKGPWWQSFRRHSTWEGVRVLPFVTRENFDVVHFIFDENEIPSAAQLALAAALRGMAPMDSRVPILAATWMGEPQLNLYRPTTWSFLQCLQIVLTEDPKFLLQIRRRLVRAKACLQEVLPPLLDATPTQNSFSAASLIEDLSLSTYLLVPGSPDAGLVEGQENCFSHSSLGAAWEEIPPLVFLAHRPLRDRSARRYFTDSLEGPAVDQIIRNCSAIWLSQHQLSLAALKAWKEKALQYNKPLLLRPRQMEILPELMSSRDCGWVLEQGVQSLLELVRNQPGVFSSAGAGQYQDSPLGGSSFPQKKNNLRNDETCNTLLRLYRLGLASRQQQPRIEPERSP